MLRQESDPTSMEQEHDEEVDEIAIMSDSEDENSNHGDDEKEKFMDEESSIMDAIEEEVGYDVPNQDQQTEQLDVNEDTSMMLEDNTGSVDFTTTLEEGVPTLDVEESDLEDEEVDEEVEESDEEDNQGEEKNKETPRNEIRDDSVDLIVKKEQQLKGDDKNDEVKDNTDEKKGVSQPSKAVEEGKPSDPKKPIVIENSLRQVYDTLKKLSKKFNYIVSARRSICRKEENTLLEIYDPLAEKSHEYFSSFHLIVFEQQEKLILKVFYQQSKVVNETRLSKNVDPTILNEILTDYLKEISPGTKKTCKGAFDETLENVGFVDYKSVLIEGNASNVVYRSRNCKIVITKGILCDACKTLLETYLCKNGLKIQDKRNDIATVNKSMLVTNSGKELLQNIESIESLQMRLQGEKMGMTYKDFLVEAILESDDKKAKLSEIYRRIYRKYPHLEGKQFENSLRHNLSLLKGKVFKQLDEIANVGKGNYWSLVPGYVHQPKPASQMKTLLKPSITDPKQIPIPKSLTSQTTQSLGHQEQRSRIRVRLDQAEEIERNIRARYEKTNPGEMNIMNVRQPQMPQQMFIQPRRSSNLPPSYAKEGLNSQIFSSSSSFSPKATPNLTAKPSPQTIALPQAVVNQAAWKSNPPKYVLMPKKEGSFGTCMSFLTQQSPNATTLNASSKVVSNHKQGTAKSIQLQNPTRKVFVDDGKLILQNNMSFSPATNMGQVRQVKQSASLKKFGTTVVVKTIPRTLK